MTKNVNISFSQISWDETLDGSGTTAAPALATDGEGIEPNKKGTYLHVAVEKTNTITLDIWGYIADADIADWFNLGTLTFTGSVNEANYITAGAIYDRIYAQVTATGGGNYTINLGTGV